MSLSSTGFIARTTRYHEKIVCVRGQQENEDLCSVELCLDVICGEKPVVAVLETTNVRKTMRRKGHVTARLAILEKFLKFNFDGTESVGKTLVQLP